MVAPTKKAPGIARFLEIVAKELYGRSRVESIQKDICVACGKAATEFSTDESQKEYAISGLCQECQRSHFDKHQQEEL